MSKYWELIWSSFLKTQGAFINVLGIALAVIAWIFVPDTSISLTVVLFVTILFFSLLVTFVHASFSAYSYSRFRLPKILMGQKPPRNSGAIVICLLEPSEIYSNDSMVSFYYVEDGNFERFIGLGRVTNIQTDGYIQVALTRTLEGNTSILRGIKGNDRITLDRVRIKPNVPMAFVGSGELKNE